MGGEALGVARRIARQIDRECVSEARLGVERLKLSTERCGKSTRATRAIDVPPGLNERFEGKPVLNRLECARKAAVLTYLHQASRARPAMGSPGQRADLNLHQPLGRRRRSPRPLHSTAEARCA
jgi:hypothetical protein